MESTEEKLITINPLDETSNVEPIKEEKPVKKRRGRKQMSPEEKAARKEARRLAKKKTTDQHSMTPARQRALLKANLVRLEKVKERKKKKEEEMKKAKEEMKKGIVLKEAPATEKNENDVLTKIGSLENGILEINKMLQTFNVGGTFNASKQSEQTKPDFPLELRQADFSTPEKSFQRVSNGGKYIEKSYSREEDNKEYVPMKVRNKYETEPFFF